MVVICHVVVRIVGVKESRRDLDKEGGRKKGGERKGNRT